MMESRIIRENDQCPICLNVFQRPTCLKSCNHIFCESCINQANSLYEHKNCPLCRKVFKPTDQVFLAERQKQLEKMYPKEFQERIKNIKQNKYYRIEVGNTTQVIATQENNKYRWTLFVRPGPGQKPLSEFVDNVQVKLHPTFHPSKVVFKGNEPVQLKRLGWGTFRIDIRIEWRKKYGGFVDTFHDLKFQPLNSRVLTCKLGNQA